MVIKNVMEDFVEQKLDAIIAANGACGCEQCRADVMAKALNDLPPHYIATEKGELFSKLGSLEFQFDADVTSTICAAIELVKRRPRHSNP
jgi:competence protein ComFB